MATRTRRGNAYADIRIGDFTGGLNLRDAPTELNPNETPDCMNVVIDEKGGARKRMGFVRRNATPLPNQITFGFESDIADCNFWYTAADGKLYQDVGGVLIVIQTFSPTGRIDMTDFAGLIYVIHSIDGLFYSPTGTSFGKVSASTGAIPNGDQLAVWQNKLWVADSTSNLLSFCAPGDATKWDSADDAGANHIREGNDFPIVCIYGTSGSDVQAQPALVVGKRSGAQGSMHRVTDAATGNYVTFDQSVGPAGPNAITSLYGRLYAVSTAGIFSTDAQSPLQAIGDKLWPLFRRDSVDYDQASGFIAGTRSNRLRFYIARVGATGNDLCLEYLPSFGAFTARSDAASVYVISGKEGGQPLAVRPGVVGQIYQLDVGGADDGLPITSRIRTMLFEPGGSYGTRLQHIRVGGRGNFRLEALSDSNQTGPEKAVLIASEGMQWDSDGWDDPLVGWGSDAIEGWADFWPRLYGHAFQVEISETSTDISSTPPLLEDGAEVPVGAWAVTALHLSFTPHNPSF